MKLQLLLVALLGTVILKAQSQNEIGHDLFKYLKSDAHVLSEGKLIKGSQETAKFIADFVATNGRKMTYTKKFNIEVNPTLSYEIGEIQTESGLFPVMFLKTAGEASGSKIEFLVIYKEKNPIDEASKIDQRRAEWMKLCNAHQASELVSELYTKDTYYYNRGRLLQGTNAVSAEYNYMNSPAYSLKLTPKHVVFVTEAIAYEIGRCSGSYPLPYLLLWEKQANGDWQILLDSNY